MEQAPEHETVAASVRNYDNPWQMPRARKSRWAKGMDLPSTGEVLFFAGCSTSLLFPDSAKAAIRLVKAAGSEPAYLGVTEKCCGSTLRKLGATELARSKAESCFRDFAGAGAKIVVTSCPGCYSALDAYTDLREEYGVEIQHISQFLSERMDRLDTGHVDGLGQVTYHDPCDLGREKGVFDEPRRLVEAALGAPVSEMAWSGADAACCGAGSGVKSGFPELALAMARQRIEQASSVGADTVVTACPWCVQNLRECQGGEPDVKVIDLVELMSQSVDAASQRRS